MPIKDTEALDRFDRLEERIIRLLDINSSISDENKVIKEAIAASEREVAGLKERIAELDREKNVVKEKIDKLLERLDSLV